MHHPRQDSTYHDLCYTSGGALAGTWNSSIGTPWRIDPKSHRTMSKRSASILVMFLFCYCSLMNYFVLKKTQYYILSHSTAINRAGRSSIYVSIHGAVGRRIEASCWTNWAVWCDNGHGNRKRRWKSILTQSVNYLSYFPFSINEQLGGRIEGGRSCPASHPARAVPLDYIPPLPTLKFS